MDEVRRTGSPAFAGDDGSGLGEFVPRRCEALQRRSNPAFAILPLRVTVHWSPYAVAIAGWFHISKISRNRNGSDDRRQSFSIKFIGKSVTLRWRKIAQRRWVCIYTLAKASLLCVFVHT